jgi:hypothetical protein
MAPLDSATQKDGEIVTKPVIPKMVDAQRRAAAAQGCAFWDTFTWMGGRGSMAAWHQRGLGADDLTHVSAGASRRVADALVDALLAGYAKYKSRL